MNLDIEKKISELLNKKFEKSNSIGYDPLDVDKYFDEQIACLSKINDELQFLNKQVNERDEKINELKEQVIQLKNANEVSNKQIELLNKEGYGNRKIQQEHTALHEKIASLEKKFNEINNK
jgi:uncharacterized phage infection (PIP) family protein YhgE